MILGIGVDLAHVPRIVSLAHRRGFDRLARRILSSEEFRQWVTLPAVDEATCARFLAVRWAVKEAAYKAFYPVIRPTWKEFTYKTPAKHTKPTLNFRPINPAVAGHIENIHVSVSHDGEYILASVVVETPRFTAV